MMNNYNRSNVDRRSSCSLCQQNRSAERRYANINPRGDLPNQSSGCGCNDNCGELLHKLQTIDFSIYELVLYLDAYPKCEDALNMYNQLVAQRCEVAAQYEHACGPIGILGNKNRNSWDWINGSFPWEYGAN